MNIGESFAGEDPEELYLHYSVWSPYILSANNEWLASKKNVGIRRAGYLPWINLSAAYNTGYYETNQDQNHHVIAFDTQIKNNQNQYLGASLTIPLFGRNAARFDVRRAKISSEQAQKRLELAKQTLQYTIEKDCNELSASWQELEQAKKQLAADKHAFQAAQKKYDQGLINAVDYYTVKNRLANTTGVVLHSKLVLDIKKHTIEFYKGNRFWENEERRTETGDGRTETEEGNQRRNILRLITYN